MIFIFLKNLQIQKISLKRKRKALTLKNAILLLNGRQNVLNAFEIGIFPKRKQGNGLTSILDKVFNHKQLRILTPKQILLRLPIALEQVKAGTEKLSK